MVGILVWQDSDAACAALFRMTRHLIYFQYCQHDIVKVQQSNVNLISVVGSKFA